MYVSANFNKTKIFHQIDVIISEVNSEHHNFNMVIEIDKYHLSLKKSWILNIYLCIQLVPYSQGAPSHFLKTTLFNLFFQLTFQIKKSRKPSWNNQSSNSQQQKIGLHLLSPPKHHNLNSSSISLQQCQLQNLSSVAKNLLLDRHGKRHLWNRAQHKYEFQCKNLVI